MTVSDDRHLGLHWGLKPSFVSYVARMPDGQMSVSDGAVMTEGNILVFEPDLDAASAGEGRFAFRGDVRFRGHAGMLFLRLADPVVVVTDGLAVLSVAGGEATGGVRLHLADLTLRQQRTEEDLLIWLATDVRLRPEATGLFNDVYAAGEPLAPLAVFLPVPTTSLG